ncbi:hypothetical protein JXB11_01065 [Candidatus Woesearchaeota archaeon]|nr:hypothetical protein [Candidatus Woesearchaeota archaeon]
MNRNTTFWIFGALQALTLGFIVYFVLQPSGIGNDTRIMLSILFPLFFLIMEYLTYSKR